MTKPIDETICPLCQLENSCGVDNEQPCWCTKTKVPETLIKQVPEELQKKACICQQCINKFNSENIVEVK